ncbi:hypothetical protein BKA70DRAFT_1250118 [Coprinopsis sp. MPI-PUGE-AT-0042]|nr:hypothetical protein BKA70DRAFT_1250118 [Coprinopsis sp. MPI-PUGE-AT-0042]
MRLPAELWLEIFALATFDPLHLSSEYQAFQPIHYHRKPTRLSTLRTLSLVCRCWKALASGMLYEDIRIQHGMWDLLRALRKSPVSLASGTDTETYTNGNTVRRAVLPYSITDDAGSTLPFMEILRACPGLEVLVRPSVTNPDFPSFTVETAAAMFPSLRRLDWWHQADAERAGGINSLGSVLKHSPRIRYLFIAGVLGMSQICMDPGPLDLPELEVLRIHVVNGLLINQMCQRWSLPALSHLIIDTPIIDPMLTILCESFGPQLRTVELGRHVRFLMTDTIGTCLRGCPGLQELNYHIFFTAAPTPEDEFSHPELHTIGLHSAVNSMLDVGHMLWGLLHRHFEFLAGPYFPNLKQVVLYGEWRAIVDHPSFVTMHQVLSERDPKLELCLHDDNIKSGVVLRDFTIRA